jgi:hypothetical protein
MAVLAPKDPAEDGPDVFDAHPGRLLIARKCDGRLVRYADLARLTGLPDANARTTARTLLGYEVLSEFTARGSKPALTLRPEWRDAVRDAKRRASRGRLQGGGRILTVPPLEVSRVARSLLSKDARWPIAWIATIPDNPEIGLMVGLDEDADEAEAWRLQQELVEAAAAHPKTLRVGRVEAATGVRGLLADLVPGADLSD